MVKKPVVRKESNTFNLLGVELPRWTAVVAGVALLLVGLVVAYYGFKMWGARPVLPTPTPGGGVFETPTPHVAYKPSELIARYGVTSTPRLVFNCNKMRTGTAALRENSYEVPQGTERQDLINVLCDISGADVFCEQKADTAVSGRLTSTGQNSCAGDDGVVQIYAFYGPICSASSAQGQVVELLYAEFPEYIELRTICVPLSDEEIPLCEQEVMRGEYDE